MFLTDAARQFNTGMKIKQFTEADLEISPIDQILGAERIRRAEQDARSAKAKRARHKNPFWD